MNHVEIGAILTVIWTGLMGIFILIRDWRRPVTRWFGIYTLTIAAWAFTYYRLVASRTYDDAKLWAILAQLPAGFIPATFLQFIQHLLGIQKNKSQKILKIFFYGIGIFFLFFGWNPKFVTAQGPIFGFRYYTKALDYYFVYVACFFSTVSIIIFLLIQSFLREKGQKRLQLGYVIGIYVAGYIAGGTVFLPNYGYPMPVLSLYVIPFCHLLLFYIIIRHHFLNIQIVVRRIGLFMLVYGCLGLSVFPFLSSYHRQFASGNLPSTSSLVLTVVIMSAILSVGPFIYAYFIRKSYYFHEQNMAGLTHELKSPLATIENVLEYFHERARTVPIDSKEAEYFDMLERNSSRLRRSVEELLQAFHSQDRQQLLNQERCDVNEIAQKIVDNYQTAIAAKKLKLIFQPSPTPATALIDRMKIGQVISNLLSNALKFTNEGTIEINIRSLADVVKIEVRDTGLGIKPEELPLIFDRFFQGEAGMKLKGSGIGLSVAKSWVEAHGGEIWAESEGEGKGAKIIFTLPIKI